jgi:hypothetical protein
MKTDKPKDNSTKPQQPFTNMSRIKAMFAAAEAELRKQFESKKV